MKNLGMVLAILGIVALVYGGISYNRQKTVLEVGSLKVTATEHRSVPIPAVVGVIALAAGVGLLLYKPRS
jgi:uncharacterized membrane protein YidH (DUF202 family)